MLSYVSCLSHPVLNVLIVSSFWSPHNFLSHPSMQKRIPPQVQNQDDTQHWCWAWWRSCHGMRSANLPMSSSVVHCQVHCQELSGLSVCAAGDLAQCGLRFWQHHFTSLYCMRTGVDQKKGGSWTLCWVKSLHHYWTTAPAVFFGTGMMAAAHKQCGTAAYAREIPTSFPQLAYLKHLAEASPV